ncbi:MAG TPA: cyclic nucleotide-binding domain-containing protein, partial [Candidatus Gracilibacteria bacterium]|nr:cyclic nucleotide-binding domain-containing protein [Candidatus Gracilibacteria bacterium]
MQIVELLHQLPFFASLSESDQLSVLENIRLHYFPADYTIIKEGSPGDLMYIIRSGQVKVFHEKMGYQETIA